MLNHSEISYFLRKSQDTLENTLNKNKSTMYQH